MSFSSIMLILSMCSFFFLSLFMMEGISDNGIEGIKERSISISGTTLCSIITLILFFITRY